MLDTNIISYVIKGRSHSAQTEMDERDPGAIRVSVISEAELWFGLLDLPQNHVLHMRVHSFLRVFKPLAWDGDAPRIYATTKRRLERAGSPLEDLDLMIAAHAISIGAVLVTNNVRHFERIGPDLHLENWHRD